MKFVGFSGPKSAGKDECYKQLKELKRVSGKISFAGPLKELCAKVFDVPMTFLNDPVFKERPLKEPITITSRHLRTLKRLMVEWLPEIDSEKGIRRYNIDKASISGIEGQVMETPRQLLQFIGTEFIRDRVYKNWHVEAAFSEKALSRLPIKSGTYAITDARFANEYEFLQNSFGSAFIGYYVERPEAEIILEKATHPSETGVREIRTFVGEANVVKNHGSLEELIEILKDLKLPETQHVVSKSNPEKEGTIMSGKFRYGPRK